jgi:hypothetical protein
MQYLDNLTSIRIRRQSGYDIFFVFLIVFLLPIDWFSLTGLAFREIGSKPLALLILGIAILEFFKKNFSHLGIKFPSIVIIEFYLILLLGLFAFTFQFFLGEVNFNYLKSPVVQFLGHCLILALSFFVVVYLAQYLIEGYSFSGLFLLLRQYIYQYIY